MTLELMLHKGINASLVLGFFLAIIFFLRFLYGPKGTFRDPEWDKWNEEAALREKIQREDQEEERLAEAFTRYATSFFTGNEQEDAPFKLKRDHTFRVLDYARQLICKESELSERDIAHLLRLTALFHDSGRFEQYKQYRTFADPMSCDHGALGVKVIRKQGFLTGETRETQRMVLAAVAMHNKLCLPQGLPPKLATVLYGVRDADKLDILRVMAEKLDPDSGLSNIVALHVKNDPDRYSEPVLRALAAGRVALYKDVRFINDFRLLLCSWLNDFHYAATLAIVAQEGHLERVIEGLAHLPEAHAKARFVMETAFGRSNP